MELYEIMDKVGSDPCVVLDFDFDLTITGDEVNVQCPVITLDSDDAAIKFVNDFSQLLLKLGSTRSVIMKATTHIDLPLFDSINGAVCYSSTFSIAFDTNYNCLNTTFLITPPLVGVAPISVKFDVVAHTAFLNATFPID